MVLWRTGRCWQCLENIIDVSESAKRLCEGRYANMSFQCRVCSHSEPAARTEDALVFYSLQVASFHKRTDQSFSNLQEAVDDYFVPNLMDVDFNWQCSKCPARQPLECWNSPELPPVLVIGLSQWVFTISGRAQRR